MSQYWVSMEMRAFYVWEGGDGAGVSWWGLPAVWTVMSQIFVVSVQRVWHPLFLQRVGDCHWSVTLPLSVSLSGGPFHLHFICLFTYRVYACFHICQWCQTKRTYSLWFSCSPSRFSSSLLCSSPLTDNLWGIALWSYIMDEWCADCRSVRTVMCSWSALISPLPPQLDVGWLYSMCSLLFVSLHRAFTFDMFG